MSAAGTGTLLFGGGCMLRTAVDGSLPSPGDPASGLFVADTRLLSLLRFDLDGRELLLSSRSESNGERALTFVPAAARNETGQFLVAVNQRVSTAGLRQELSVLNTSASTVSATLTVEAATDFADQFELRSDKRSFTRDTASRTATVGDGLVTLGYSSARRNRSFGAGTAVHFSGSPLVSLNDDDSGVTLAWRLELDAGQRADIRLSFETIGETGAVRPLHRVENGARDPLRERALDDLEALRMPSPGSPEHSVVAAGVPWFLTLFGRDSLIASLLSEPALPGIVDGTLRALAATQAQTTDARRVAEPGKIVHELRRDELSTLDEVPYGRYYGSVDSTPLFLIGLAASANAELVAELEPEARAAVEWMLGPGGIAEHGFLRYVPDPDGLVHQGWKDSFDAIAHADGRIAEGAIALAEAQGYAWRALVDTAALARRQFADPEWATELEDHAETLRSRFRSEFWMPGHNFPALAIDGAGARVEVVASNAGHLLWSGILDHADAQRVTARLLEPDLFTGWGIRTLSSRAALYHPLSYHNGSVWPHDTMLAAVGMESYGFSGPARLLAGAVRDAAEHFEWRLPELFGGFDRGELPQPVGYPHAARPQAWAAAAAVAAARLSQPH